jgi:formate hydrogenlyase subunit 6/NADH:ubiquinone oxidoreductase subunit I
MYQGGSSMSLDERRLYKARKLGIGIGLVKGLAVTLKHLFKHNTVIEYPDEKQDLGPRTRGVIALKEENCTVCMLCARECPDWCIYIDSHKETLPPKREGGRPRKRNVLDRFAIDYALCMYCGICVEVCPYDALFWSREFEYAEYDIRELTHEKERLSDWMSTVLPPPPLDEGAEQPGRPSALPAAANGGAPAVAAPVPAAIPAATPAAASATPAPAAPPATKPAAGATTPASAPTLAPEGATEIEADRLPPAPAAKEPEAQEPEAAAPAEGAPEKEAVAEPAGAPAESTEPALSAEDKAAFSEQPGPNVEVPHEAPRPVSLQPTEDAEAVYQAVLEEQKQKGSSPQVAEARARVARAKAERGIQRGPTPLAVDKPVPSAPTKGHAEPEPSGAPEAKAPEPDPGPVAPTPTVEAKTPETATETTTPEPPAASSSGDETPDQVFERVLAEEKAKGSSDAVATGRAKAARVKAERAQGKG